MATARSNELRALAQRVADALPVDVEEEVVLTGSVSRGTADEVSGIEMLVVTREPPELEDCFGLATAPTLAEDRGVSWPGSWLTRKISLPVDEDLIPRAHEQDTAAAAKADGEVVEDARTVYLRDRALDEACAQGTLTPNEADRLAVEEVRAVRRARRRAA